MSQYYDDDEVDDLLDELAGDDDQVVVGYDEIVGAEDIVGARPRRRRTALSMQQARQIDPNAVRLVKRAAGPRRKKILAGTTTSVGAGSTAIITYESQENFRPEEFFVQGVNIDSFLIESIKIGTEEQLVNTGAVPADVFGPDGLRSNIQLKTMNVGTVMAVVVRNTSAGALDFNSAFIGTAVD